MSVIGGVEQQRVSSVCYCCCCIIMTARRAESVTCERGVLMKL